MNTIIKDEYMHAHILKWSLGIKLLIFNDAYMKLRKCYNVVLFKLYNHWNHQFLKNSLYLFLEKKFINVHLYLPPIISLLNKN